MHCSQFTVSQFFFEGVALLHGIISYTYLYIYLIILTLIKAFIHPLQEIKNCDIVKLFSQKSI